MLFLCCVKSSEGSNGGFCLAMHLAIASLCCFFAVSRAAKAAMVGFVLRCILPSHLYFVSLLCQEQRRQQWWVLSCDASCHRFFTLFLCCVKSSEGSNGGFCLAMHLAIASLLCF